MAYTYNPIGQNEAASTNDTVSYSFTLINDGLLSLYNVSMNESILHAHGAIIPCVDVDGTIVVASTAGVLDGFATYPNNGLAPARQISCTAKDTVFQEEVRREDSFVRAKLQAHDSDDIAFFGSRHYIMSLP